MTHPEYFQERMTRLMEDPGFKKKLGGVATFSRRTGHEAGFVAYATQLGFRLSRILKPQASDYDRDDFGINNGMDEFNSLRMGELTNKVVKGKAEPRDDLLFVAHSHACEVHQAAMMLCPSIQDITVDEKHWDVNPEVVSGVLVSGPANKGSLLLYRRNDPNRPGFYQQMDDNHSTPNILLQSMRDSGITTAVLRFTVERSVAAYDQEQASRVIQALYPPVSQA